MEKKLEIQFIDIFTPKTQLVLGMVPNPDSSGQGQSQQLLYTILSYKINICPISVAL